MNEIFITLWAHLPVQWVKIMTLFLRYTLGPLFETFEYEFSDSAEDGFFNS